MVRLVPLEHSSTDAARSRNIAKLRREGYPEKRAVAAAYREQRKMKKLARRRRTGLAKRNPSGDWAHAFTLTAVLAGLGAGGGVIYADSLNTSTSSTTMPLPAGALVGASLGASAMTLWGLGGAIFTKDHVRGLTLAGVGFAASVLSAAGASALSPAAAALSTTTGG
jgi:hypothetical protein